MYEVEEDRSKHQVTPLWCAAVANRLEVVKSLVQHGAEINSPSDTDSTPVRSACYMTNVAVIKYLVDNGANIHKPNINGGTCLINSVQNAELCLFLINKGADVNARDNSGNLALHYAIREGRIETVKLLLKYGSNYRTKNDFMDDAIQTAALRGHQNIVDCILDMTDLTMEHAIRAYELLGSNFVDEKNDMVAALTIWKKAMRLRYSDRERPLLKCLPKETNYVYGHCREPNTLEELENLFDPEEIYMQALLIRERILGHSHKDTTFGLMYRGAVYADSLRYQRCVDLWKYACILRHERSEPMSQECLFTIQGLVKLFWEIQVEVESSAVDEVINPPDPLEVLDIVTEQIKSGQDVLKKPTSTLENLSDFQILLQLFLHLIHLISRLECTDDTKTWFLKSVRKVVMLDPRGRTGETLLHLALDPQISLTSEEFFSTIPSLKLVQILVACGADVNAVNNSGNTPLFNSVKMLSYHELQNEGILDFLLKSSAHVDKCNNKGETALELIQREASLAFCPLNHITLKCLASRVIMRENIPFLQEIPRSLVPFVEMHGPRIKRD